MDNLFRIAGLINNKKTFSYKEREEFRQWLEWERWAFCNYFQIKRLGKVRSEYPAKMYAKHRFGVNWAHYLVYVERVIKESIEYCFLTSGFPLAVVRNPQPNTLPQEAYNLLSEMVRTGIKFTQLGDNLPLRYLHVAGLVKLEPDGHFYKYVPNDYLWSDIEEPFNVKTELMKKFEIRFIDPAGNRQGEMVEIISHREPTATQMLHKIWPKAKDHILGVRIGAEVFSPQTVSSVHGVGTVISVFKIDEDALLVVDYYGKVEVVEYEIQEIQ